MSIYARNQRTHIKRYLKANAILQFKVQPTAFFRDRKWLKENGYDEEGKRTEEWTNEIVITYSVAYDFEKKQNNQSKEDWYQSMYGSKKSSEQAAKEAEKVKENTEKVADLSVKILKKQPIQCIV